MTKTFYLVYLLLVVINTVQRGLSIRKSVRIPAEFSNALKLLRPPDRTTFIKHCLHQSGYICSQQEVRRYVWGLEDSQQFQFSNFWNWYRCTKTGNLNDCPVNGGWSVWSTWGECDVTCGQDGLKSRFRTCDSPEPKNGGRDCDGQTIKITKCGMIFACQNDSTIFTRVHDNYLKQLHKSNPQLKRKCLRSHCSYQEIQDIIDPKEEANKYWSYINCYKHSEGCPVDGVWSSWGEWSRCSSNCGHGHHYHLRHCNAPRPLNSGNMCEGSFLENAPCFENNCTNTVGLHFSPWSHWSHCSVSCGEGIRQSIRRCIGEGTCLLADGTPRERIIKESPCETPSCLRLGGWSEWSEWSMCTAVCGRGERAHTRSCTDPIPVGPGSACEGDQLEKEPCSHSEPSCFTNDTQPLMEREYSNWGRWSACSATCAGGTKLRHRSCVDEDQDMPCVGALYDVEECNEHIPCPVDGDWSEWTEWSSCSETCDSGFAERHRLCTIPRPAFGGAVCSGPATERKDCQNVGCPELTPSWGEWGNWSQCTVSCDGGTNTRSRSCLVQEEIVATDRCGGEYRQLGACSPEACPVNGNWANWNEWRPCSVKCGEGITSRDRTCTNPAPIGSGSVCDGYGTESRHCYSQPCTEHGDVMRLFDGNSFLMYRKSGNPTKQVLIYLRLLPESSDGLILMKRYEHHEEPLIYVSLLNKCVYLYAKFGSAELKVVGYPVTLFEWNTIQVSITGNLGHVRVNDEYTHTGNFTDELSENLDYDIPLYLGGCMPHLYPEDESMLTDWTGFVGKIATFRMNYYSMSLIEDVENWQGANRPYTSLNSGIEMMDIMAAVTAFNGEQFSTIQLKSNENLQDIQAVVNPQDSIGLLLFVSGSISGSFLSLELAKGKLFLSVRLRNRVMELERDLDEIQTWIIIDIQIEVNQVSLRVNKGPASQLSGPGLQFFTPATSVYVGGLPSWRRLRLKEYGQLDISGFNGNIYKIKLNAAEYFIEDMFKQSWDQSVDSASATLAVSGNFHEYYVVPLESVQLRCRYTTYRHDFEVVWLKENQIVDTTLDHIRLEENNVFLPNTTILHLHSIDKERQGMYGCQFRYPDRAEIYQAFAISLIEPHDVLAHLLSEWMETVLIFFAAVLLAAVVTTTVTCAKFVRKRPYYVLKILHTALHAIGFGKSGRTTLADLQEVDRTFDGRIDIKQEKKRLDKLELSRRKRLREAAKQKIRKKKENITHHVKKMTGKPRDTSSCHKSWLVEDTSLRFSDNENYIRKCTRLQLTNSLQKLQSEAEEITDPWFNKGNIVEKHSDSSSTQNSALLINIPDRNLSESLVSVGHHSNSTRKTSSLSERDGGVFMENGNNSSKSLVELQLRQSETTAGLKAGITNADVPNNEELKELSSHLTVDSYNRPKHFQNAESIFALNDSRSNELPIVTRVETQYERILSENESNQSMPHRGVSFENKTTSGHEENDDDEIEPIQDAINEDDSIRVDSMGSVRKYISRIDGVQFGNKSSVVMKNSSHRGNTLNDDITKKRQFNNRVLHLAELLSMSGVTPPIKPQVTNPVTSPLEDDEDTEEEYEDTHE
ncbi:uncharacterized protein LOC117109720 [Anneissia japonica]|uniref:uncharacterized protein LOC117109720 n=1 Tax=Anneissia japonica TaxID=1529436 RepID=UPI0014256F01|nr:uncharacterized protein LOC117109720 [Anneissia japonica]